MSAVTPHGEDALRRTRQSWPTESNQTRADPPEHPGRWDYRHPRAPSKGDPRGRSGPLCFPSPASSRARPRTAGHLPRALLRHPARLLRPQQCPLLHARCIPAFAHSAGWSRAEIPTLVSVSGMLAAAGAAMQAGLGDPRSPRRTGTHRTSLAATRPATVIRLVELLGITSAIPRETSPGRTCSRWSHRDRLSRDCQPPTRLLEAAETCL
jgi:hypothetical protein